MRKDSLSSTDVAENRSFYGRRTSLAVIGDVIVLANQYDEDQLWFSFSNGFVIINQHRGPPVNFSVLWNDGQDSVYDIGLIDHMAENPEIYSVFIPDEDEVPQYLLPFHEYRRQRREETANLHRTGFASFERDENGEVLRFPFQGRDREALEDWLDENCQGRYVVDWDAIYVERCEDAIPLRLRL